MTIQKEKMPLLLPGIRQENSNLVDDACSMIIREPLRDILDIYIKPEKLSHEVKKSQSALNLNLEEKLKCCPESPDYNDFDEDLLYKLIKNLCCSVKPTKGWGEKPEATNTELGDDIERLIQFKDEIMALVETKNLDDSRSEDVWNDLEFAIDRIQKFAIKHEYTPTYQYNLKYMRGKISKDEDGDVIITREYQDVFSLGNIGVVNITMLKKNPNLQHYIVGIKDATEVVKVFLCGDDKEEEKARADFEKAVVIPKTIHIEFVNLDKRSKEILKEREEIQKHEEKESVIEESKRIKMQKVINKHKRKLFKKHSNILGITSSNVRYDGKTYFAEPCIVFYCFDKNVVPFGEEPLPTQIEGWHCDHREELSMFATCPSPCLVSNKAFPELGCSIGVESSDEVGSTGFLVESNKNDFEHGFLTAAHVAVQGYDILYKRHKFMYGFVPLTLQMTTIVHHYSSERLDDQGHKEVQTIEKRVGSLVEAICGNYTDRGIDFAFVHSDFPKRDDTEEMTIINENDMPSSTEHEKRVHVIKTGRATGTTTGYIKEMSFDCRFIQQNDCYTFYDCYGIAQEGKEIFAKYRDSGSAVFVVEINGTLKPLGILFAIIGPITAVCKIDEIIEERCLRIVKIKDKV